MLRMRNLPHDRRLVLTLATLCFVARPHAADSANAVPTVTNTAPPLPVAGVVPATAAPTAAPTPPPSSAAKRSAADLEKLVIPIALHPDPLIAILLPAAVYPVEIVQAARFVKETNNIPKIDEQSWDANVKAVAKFPELIAQMDADLAWTVELGQTFLDQPKELMDTIQALRAKAQKAGTLLNTPQQIVTVTNIVLVQTNVTQVVTVTNQVVQVQPANPQVVYVPTYPPTAYYPPPSYVYDPVAPLVTFGVGMAVGAIIANNCDWHGGGIYVGGGGMVVWGGGGYHGDVDVDVNRNVNVNQNINQSANVNRGERPPAQSGNRAPSSGARPTPQPTQQKWQPDQSRLRTSGAAGASAGTMESRGWSSASTRPSTQPGVATRPAPSTGNVGARPSTGTAAPRPSTGAASASRPTASPSVNRPSSSPATSAGNVFRPAASPSVSRPTPSAGSGGSAFSGVSSGASARDSSSRGSASRSGGFSGGGGRSMGGRGGGGRGR